MPSVAGQQRKELDADWYRPESGGGAHSHSPPRECPLRPSLPSVKASFCETYCVWSQDDFTLQVCPQDPTVTARAPSPSRVWSPLSRAHSSLGRAPVSLSLGGGGRRAHSWCENLVLTVREWTRVCLDHSAAEGRAGACVHTVSFALFLPLCLSQFHHLPKGGATESLIQWFFHVFSLRESAEKSWIPSPGK